MKKKWKWLAGSMALLILSIVLAVPFVALKEAQAFTEGYEITEENALRFPVKQKKASSSATVKYETVSWYLFKNKLGGSETGYQNASASDWRNEAFQVSTTRVDRTNPDSAGIFWDTMEMDAATFLSGLKKLYSRNELLNESGITLYASRVLRKVNASGTEIGGPYYNFTEFSKAAGWSDGTLWAVEEGYNIPITVTLATADFDVRYVVIDEKGNESEVNHVTGFTFGGANSGSDSVGGQVLYGETLTFGSASYTGKEYTYKGYQWTSKSGSSVTAGNPSAITVDRTYAPNGTLELTFYFEKKAEPTPLPFVSPTAAPTQVPGATVTPTPTVAPTAIPTPTPKPITSGIFENIYEHYYTTDAGYWIGKLADSTTDKLAHYNSSTGSGTLAGSSYTSRNRTYSQGTDASGNTWYFIPVGTNARFVHPKTYNGYAVDSASVKYITALVFPSTITSGGTTYTVTHIGGGTAKYKEEEPTASYGTYVNTATDYQPAAGEYYYDYYYNNTSAQTQTSRYNVISYSYGVLGNGEIVSHGENRVTTITDYSQKIYINSYYFYNTTLKSITIPSTVTEIETGAFYFCQALETIHGGAGLVDIRSHAFEVEPYPAAKLSRTWTDSGISCYEYYYYNESYSTSAATSVMAAWQKTSVLSPELVFPVLPKLTTLGVSSFMNHHNIKEVDLPASIATIQMAAFSGCKLDHIRIPNASCSIYDLSGSTAYYNTLGTKGMVGELTAIHTVPNSTALNYGLKYNAYYRLYCGYPVTYQPNGGNGSAVELYSALHVDYLEDISYLDYKNYKSSGSYSYSSNSYQYASYLDENGILWRIDKTNKKAAVVSSGTTFTELFEAGDGTAHFAWDASGNLWFSGQQRYRYVNDADNWYDSYSSMYDWKKITLPANAAKVKCTDMGVFTLNTSGVVYQTYLATTYNKALNSSGPYFTEFMVGEYDGSTDVENNAMLYGIDSSNVLWQTARSGYNGFSLSMGGLSSSEYTKSSVLSGVAVKAMEFIKQGGNTYSYFITSDGSLRIVYGSRTKTYSGYGFTKIEKTPYDGMLLKDSSGNTYFAYAYYSSGLQTALYKLAPSGVSIKWMWKGSCDYIINYAYGSDSWSGMGTDAVEATRLYVWTSDGYLSAVPLSARLSTGDSTSREGSSVWKMASVPFKKIVYDSGHIYGIAEDGTLWSAGRNLYGELGNPNQESSFGYTYPVADSWKYLTKTGSRTYEEIYIESMYSSANMYITYALAKGTDGNVYFAGSGSRYDGAGFSEDVNEFVATADNAWPGSNRYVRGYDYDTEIAYGMFDRTGYDFTGWNTKADGSGTAYQPGTFVDLSSALTLYAQWGVKSRHISFNANGGSGYMAPITLAASVTSATLTKNTFERSGYDFAGWNTRADGSGISYADETTVTGITGDLILYAKWSKKMVNYTLVYMTYPYGSRSNTAWKTKSLSYETEETVEGAPYTTSGYTVSYSINKTASMSTTPTLATLTPANTSTAAPTFDSWQLYKYVNGTLVYRGRSYEQGQTVSRLTQTDGDVFYLYPSWGGANASVILPVASCTGYGFSGWSETTDGTGTIHTVGESDEDGIYTPSRNITLYAIWKPLTYNVSLDGQSADIHIQTNVTMTFDATCPSVTVPVRSRYIFMGYYTGTEGTGTQYYDKTGASLKTWRISDGSVTTLYAYWVPDKAISYDANGGVGTMETTWVEAGKTGAALTINAFTKTGYHFDSWNTKADKSGTSYADGAYVDGITGRMTLYAQWAPNTYTIALNYNGGTKGSGDTSPYTVTYDSGNYSDLSFCLPTRTGYTFTGWYTAASGGTKVYNDDGSCTTDGIYWSNSIWRYLDNVTLFAQWQVKEYDIILNDRGATSTNHTENVHLIFNQKGKNIVVPAKTGYSFNGYFTGTRGSGTEYYDASGASVKRWEEDEVDTLYAYWVQNPIIFPEEEEWLEPVPLPELFADGSVARGDSKGMLYADDYNSDTDALTDRQPYLTYDTAATVGVIPGTEEVAFRARMGAWMFCYKLHRNTGTDYVRFYVTVPYRTQYEQFSNEELIISTQQTKTYSFLVPKVWSYWEIVESGMYYPDKVTITNDAIKDKSFTVVVNQTGNLAVELPEYETVWYGEKENHVFWDEYDADGYPMVRLNLKEEQYIISDEPDKAPDIDFYLTRVCKAEINKEELQARVRSDKLILDGNVLVSDTLNADGNGEYLHSELLEKCTDQVELTLYQQTYLAGITLDEFMQNGVYATKAAVTYVGDEQNVNMPLTIEVPLGDVNALNIHTPVACDGVVVDGMEDGIILLKDGWNFFTLRVDNTGTHRNNLGYGAKNFLLALSGKSNVAKKDGQYLNQVKFPFDVYVDYENNSLRPDGTYNMEGDYCLEAGNWLTLGISEQQFYVPLTMKNGNYRIEFRTVAVNCPKDASGQYRTELVQKYTNLENSNYIATDVLEVEVMSFISDFFIADTNDPEALKQLRNGCQALTLKKGYEFSYELLSQGAFYGKNAEILIIPNFFWQSKDGTERSKIVLDQMSEIPYGEWKECYIWENIPESVPQENQEWILQRWGGRGMVPNSVLCIAEEMLDEYTSVHTLTGKESFLKTDGYLIVNFEIKLQSNEGIWYVFKNWEDTELAQDAREAGWNYLPGDVIRYDLSQSVKDDYEVGGVE